MKKFSGVKYNSCVIPVYDGDTIFWANCFVRSNRTDLKGGHRHNHIYNAINRATFRSKNARQIPPELKKNFIAIFELQFNQKPIHEWLKGGKKW